MSQRAETCLKLKSCHASRNFTLAEMLTTANHSNLKPTRFQMDHSKHTPLRPDEMMASTVEGAHVYDPDDNSIGKVSHMHGSDMHAQVIIDVGGFLGMGARPVALQASRLNFMRDEGGTVHATTAMTKDELKQLPEHTE